MAEEEKKPRGLAQALGFKDGRDMFDGGGRNAVGDTFKGGGPLSALANAMNIAPAGYHARQAEARANAPAPTRAAQMQQRGYRQPTRGTKDYRFFQDIRDGGGMGYSGNSFQGAGGYSVLAKMLGVNPLGYDERMAEAQALAATTPHIASGTSVSAPRRDFSGTEFEPASYQFEPVATSPVSGPLPIEAMSMEELIRIANQGIHNSTRDRLGNGTFIYK